LLAETAMTAPTTGRRFEGLEGWIRSVATALVGLTFLTGGAAVLAWHAPWILAHATGPLTIIGFLAILTGMVTFAASLLFLRRSRLRPSTMFIRVPSRLVAVALVGSVAVGVSGTALAHHRADGFYPDEATPSCWQIAKNHGAITRCVTHEKWLSVDRLHQLENVAGLTLFLSIVVVFLAGVVLKASNDDTSPTSDAIEG
jgi:hypothetical protein